jgi:urease accessory protein
MWIGRLSLDFERSGGKTVIARRRHEGPLLIQRPFYEPDGTCQVYLIHPPGGVVGGDELMLTFEARGGARALITTPGATKLYRSPGVGSRVSQNLRVSGGAALEWLPQETIVYAGASASTSMSVQLDDTSHFVGWDVTCLGQDNRGLVHGQLTQKWQLERGGRLLWTERAEIEGGGALQDAPWGLAGRTVFGTLVATGASTALVDEVRGACPGSETDWLSVTRLGEVLLCRYLGYSAEAAKHCFRDAWAVVRRRVLGQETRPPRVWAT